MGDPTPDGAQLLLARVDWCAAAVDYDLLGEVWEYLNHSLNGVPVVDETGFLK